MSRLNPSISLTLILGCWKKDFLRPPYFVAVSLLFFLLSPRIRNFFYEGGERWVYILLLSFVISYCITPVAKVLSHRYRLLDVPDDRKLHSLPVPLLGGIAIFTAFFIAIYLNGIFKREVDGVIIGASLVFLSGLFDDIIGLSSRFRLFIQTLATLILFFFNVSIVIFSPEGFGLIFNLTVTLIWMLGITNSMNFFDGMDGLATGLSILISGFLSLVAFKSSQPFLGWLAIAILGSCIGFLPYNFSLKRKATIFLGDSGSNFLGFTLAALAIMGEWSEDSLIASLITPVLIFSVLIYDLIYITIERFLAGKVHSIKEWLDYVGRDHLHHRLEALLLCRKKSVLLIYLLSITLSMNALILRNASAVEALLLLLQASAVLIVVTILEIVGNKRDRRRG